MRKMSFVGSSNEPKGSTAYRPPMSKNQKNHFIVRSLLCSSSGNEINRILNGVLLRGLVNETRSQKRKGHVVNKR